MANILFKYRVIAEWSGEDECFVARVPAFPGLAAHGESAEAAAKEALVAGESMLEELEEFEERGEQAPDVDSAADYSGQFRLRISPSMHRRIAANAKAENMSLNAMVQSMLAEQLGRSHDAVITERELRNAQIATEAERSALATISKAIEKLGEKLGK